MGSSLAEQRRQNLSSLLLVLHPQLVQWLMVFPLVLFALSILQSYQTYACCQLFFEKKSEKST